MEKENPHQIGGRTKAWPNRPLHPGEIARTEQKYSASENNCQYCGNHDAQRIVDTNYLPPFFDWYKGKPFRVYSCYLCGGLWHFEVPLDKM